jgi:Mu transposase, C-terminal
MDYVVKNAMCTGREAVRQTGVPQYLGAPDDLKLLLRKAQNRKVRGHAYHVHDRSRLSFQGNWYVCPGLLNRLADREFEIYYDRRDISVIYLFVDGRYVGEAYCPAFMGQRTSWWEAKVMRRTDAAKAKATASASADVRAQIQAEIIASKKQRGRVLREQEKARQFDRQREEIHPSHALETLNDLAPPERENFRLPKATPDAGRAPREQILPIRYREKEVDR